MRPAGTLMVQGDLKQMSSKWLKGISMLGYGPTLAVGLGIPIPILNAEMEAQWFQTAVENEQHFNPNQDWEMRSPRGGHRRASRHLGGVTQLGWGSWGRVG